MMMNINLKSLTSIKLAVLGSVLLMAATHSVSIAEVPGTDTTATGSGSKASQSHVTNQQPNPHQSETKDNPSLSQTDSSETSTPTHTSLKQETSSPVKQGVEASDHRDITSQTKIVIPTLSRDTDPLEEAQAGPMLVAMAQKPTAAAIPGTMQQDMINSNKQTTQPEQKDRLKQEQEQQLTNIDPQAISRGINLLNKYYPGLGQVTLQPIQQLLPTNPLIARQGAVIAQNLAQEQILPTNNLANLEQNNDETQTNKINQQLTADSDVATLPNVDNHSNLYNIGARAAENFSSKVDNKGVYRPGVDPSLPTSAKSQQAADYATRNAKPKSEGYCARYVQNSHRASGIKVEGRNAKDYGPQLEKNGFNKINIDYTQAKKGDVVVFQAIGNRKYGHTAIYNGEQWVSDFKQKSFFVHKDYTRKDAKWQIYRQGREK